MKVNVLTNLVLKLYNSKSAVAMQVVGEHGLKPSMTGMQGPERRVAMQVVGEHKKTR
jgi:hypothetical protein